MKRVPFFDNPVLRGQLPTWRARLVLILLFGGFTVLAGRALFPVSYTHLDVYKRQALPSFASRWLLPRLPAFRQRHPEIEFRVDSSARLWPGDDEFDLGIRSGLGRWPGMKADLIAREYLSPVCHPRLAEGPPALSEPADLASVMLLHDEPRAAWRQWCELAQVSLDLTRGVQFSDAALVLHCLLYTSRCV